MKRIIEHFDRTYIINLRDRTDRRRGTVRELARIGIELPHPKIEFLTVERPTEKGDFPTLGARGCFTSHRQILRLAAHLQNVLVLEDDIAFCSVANEAVERIVAALDQAWDVIYFGYLSPADTGEAPLYRTGQPTIGGHFYAANSPFIKTMEGYMTECEKRPQEHPLGGPRYRDGAYNHIRLLNPDIRAMLASPNLATQRSSRTDLHPLQFYDRSPLLRPIMNSARSIKNLLR